MEYDTINDAQTIAGNGEGTLLAGRYRIVRQLGQGGMGSVWLAKDTQLDDKPFAIKMLPSILVSNKRAYRQLKDEALVAMKLTHPNIVTLRAFEENNGNPFLVMDYIDGQTLDDYLADYNSRVDGENGRARSPSGPQSVGSRVPRDRDGRARSPSGPFGDDFSRDDGRGTRPACPPGGISEADVLRILRPIAAALDYAHGEGVVHRDVKPANVMIRKDGHPFILDFGIAREIQETMTRVTGKLSSGTLLYMSPEQLMGEAPKPAQDIYSFAAMAYECLKGEPPFSHGQIEFQIMNKQPEPLAGISTTGSLPVGANGLAARSTSIAALVMAGLAKKPEDRPPSCAAVLEEKDFSRAERVDSENGRARSPSGPQSARIPRDRDDAPVGSRVPRDRSGGPRPVAAVKGILVAALIAALAGGAWWLVNARTARSTGATGVPPVATEAAVAEIAVEATMQKARIERIDDALDQAAQAAAQTETERKAVGKMFPLTDDLVRKVVPKPAATLKQVAAAGEKFPAYVAKDASGATVGYAVVGTGEGAGPKGKIVLHILFGFTAAKVPVLHPQVILNQPDVPMTDMEAAQRSAYTKARDAAFTRVRVLAD